MSDTRDRRTIEATPCPRCHAPVGKPCASATGKPDAIGQGRPFVHSERRQAWMEWKRQQGAK